MASLPQHITDHTLLCEQCGYILEGLDPAANCPECGKAIAGSLPSRRTGTPWQVSREYVAHCRMLMSEPSRLFDALRIGLTASDHELLGQSSRLTAALLILPLCPLVFDGQPIVVSILGLLPLLLFWSLSSLAITALTSVEQRGVVYFSRKRGWRASPEQARAVCANAAPGWLAAGVLMNLGYWMMPIADQLMNQLVPRAWGSLRVVVPALPLLGFIAGMLVFETLVYIGVRRCKYANWIERPAPAP